MTAGSGYDVVVVVGAGHNGLMAAACLARGGLRVLMLERCDVVGCCVISEEVDTASAPGCRVSTTSCIASMLRPGVIRDRKLGPYGLRMVACEPGAQSYRKSRRAFICHARPGRNRRRS